MILSTKLTVLLLYRRVFLPHRWSVFDIILRVFMGVCCLYYISTFIAKIWSCTPRAKIWNKSVEGTCINVASVLTAGGVFNTLSDVFILLVPVKAVWNLQMKTARKVEVCLLFTVGSMYVFSTIQFRLPSVFMVPTSCQGCANKYKRTDIQYQWLGCALA